MCVVNAGTIIHYFNKVRGVCQGDPFLVYLLMLTLQNLFLFIEKDPEIKAIKIFGHFFFYTSYVDDTNFI